MSDPSHPDLGPPLRAVVDAMPGAVLVIDQVGTILLASARAASLVDDDPQELVGRSVLEFVDDDTAWIYAASVAMATDYPDVVTGPLRVTIRTPTGDHRRADLWALNRIADHQIRGIVCLLTEATVSSGLAQAIGAMTADEPLTEVAELVVEALAGAPVGSMAALLAPRGDGFAAIASNGLGDDLVEAGVSLWRRAMEGQRIIPGALDELVEEDQRSLSRHRAGPGAPPAPATVWVEPVVAGGRHSPGGPADSSGGVRGVLVLARSRLGPPSPNQLSSMHEAAVLLSLAWERHEARS